MSSAIYVGHDAELSFLILKRDGSPLDLVDAGVTRVVLALAGITVDLAETPEAFDLSEGSSGKVNINLTGIPFPTGSYGARLAIYYPARPFGVVVADGYPINIGKAIF